MTQRLLLITLTALLLAGCEIPGMGPDPKAVKKEADAKAIGSACRHGLRSIEDCYTLNTTASKADMFTGWKDMDLYMRENKIEGVPATVVKAAPPVEGGEDAKANAEDTADATEKPAKGKGGTKVAAKSAGKASAH